MAAVTWVCPVGDCAVRQDRPGSCTVDLVQLVRQTEPEAPAADPPAPAASGLALDCPWGQLVDIPAEELSIGRSSPAFRGGGIDHYDQVSRAHARLFWIDGHLHVDDLNSANGTFVDGQKITPGAPVALNAGQELRLGLDVPCRIVQLNEFGEPV
ncbi:FHA domain-containing protein [Micromonospora inaquosa]|uniref:FHA domain-containing protein n=1 Tax=Micromonospora inaquosa TaxID=2203716 RepID=UPI001ABFE2AB|nr:FHA domain-containing protein [Micromonospora inaquosa]